MAVRGILPLSTALQNYVVAHSMPPDAVAQELERRTAELGTVARMQIGHDQGALLTILTRLVGTRVAVEVGTFTGYSALCIARGLAPGGRLLCCDVNEEWTAMARQAWRQAGVDALIDLKIAPAIETLRALPATEHIDLAFVDADKASYGDYLEELIPRLRPNGVVLVDNTLWSGAVIDDSDTSADTIALRAVNERYRSDDRVDTVILTVGDGLTMMRKH